MIFSNWLLDSHRIKNEVNVEQNGIHTLVKSRKKEVKMTIKNILTDIIFKLHFTLFEGEKI